MPAKKSRKPLIERHRKALEAEMAVQPGAALFPKLVVATRNPSTGEAGPVGTVQYAKGQPPVPLGAECSHPSIAAVRGWSRRVVEMARDIEYVVEDAVTITVGPEDGCIAEGAEMVLTDIQSLPRTTAAKVRIAHGLAMDELIDGDAALQAISPFDLDEVLAKKLSTSGASVLCEGLGVFPGAAVGRVYPDAGSLPAEVGAEGAILVVDMTTPEDMEALHRCTGIVTCTGGPTSHAAVVAKQRGIPCIVSASLPDIGLPEEVSIDGATGRIYGGILPMYRDTTLASVVDDLVSWAAKTGAEVYTNADSGKAVKAALAAGAAGVGLCRTEHMFFGGERTAHFRRWILDEDPGGRAESLRKLYEFQVQDFVDLFGAGAKVPVTVRLLDPPLHEFLPDIGLPKDDALVSTLEGTGMYIPAPQEEWLAGRISSLKEQNPMMGHRGCRLGITSPELYVAQMEAVVVAFGRMKAKYRPSELRVMIPLVSEANEYAALVSLLTRAVGRALKAAKIGPKTRTAFYRRIKYGAMLETPRACLVAGDLAETGMLDFVSFGTNDLTQLTYGFSRDDAPKFLQHYVEHGYVGEDPFISLDRSGVAVLMANAVDAIREADESISIGLCGEAGADPASILVALRLGCDYVSCSPAFTSSALLASAQARLFLQSTPN